MHASVYAELVRELKTLLQPKARSDLRQQVEETETLMRTQQLASPYVCHGMRQSAEWVQHIFEGLLLVKGKTPKRVSSAPREWINGLSIDAT